MISDFLSGDSQCAACGALANFMCSACKGVHYCSTQCQVRIHIPIINIIMMVLFSNQLVIVFGTFAQQRATKYETTLLNK